ncbi:hypothetical protein [Bacillus atrophaeus]|uniref:hypothetical protein n=1 Tax=Bacillus atrophaeus TaxID=1452 RepID=UPI0030F48E75
MHYYLESTESATIELFSAYEVAKAQWEDYALHKGQGGYISNHHKKAWIVMGRLIANVNE